MRNRAKTRKNRQVRSMTSLGRSRQFTAGETVDEYERKANSGKCGHVWTCMDGSEQVKLCCFIHLPSWQVLPVQNGGHRHWKPCSVSSHVAPRPQGLESHCNTAACKQNMFSVSSSPYKSHQVIKSIIMILSPTFK